jgi:hypothetical protein
MRHGDVVSHKETQKNTKRKGRKGGKVTGAGGIAEGVKNIPEGHLSNCQLSIVNEREEGKGTVRNDIPIYHLADKIPGTEQDKIRLILSGSRLITLISQPRRH